MRHVKTILYEIIQLSSKQNATTGKSWLWYFAIAIHDVLAFLFTFVVIAYVYWSVGCCEIVIMKCTTLSMGMLIQWIFDETKYIGVPL